MATLLSSAPETPKPLDEALLERMGALDGGNGDAEVRAARRAHAAAVKEAARYTAELHGLEEAMRGGVPSAEQHRQMAALAGP